MWESILRLTKTLAVGCLSSPRGAAWSLAEILNALARIIRPTAAPARSPEEELANAVPLQEAPHPPPNAEEESYFPPDHRVIRRLEELTMPYTCASVPRSSRPRENEYDALISRAAGLYAVPAGIIKAVIATESSFRPWALREEPRIGDRSRGLMQILEKTARGLGFQGDLELLCDPEVNIMLGTKLLAQLYRRFGPSWADALAAYNGGTPRKVNGRLVPILQTYVDKVLANAKRLGGANVAAGGVGALGLVLLTIAALRRSRS